MNDIYEDLDPFFPISSAEESNGSDHELKQVSSSLATSTIAH